MPNYRVEIEDRKVYVTMVTGENKSAAEKLARDEWRRMEKDDLFSARQTSVLEIREISAVPRWPNPWDGYVIYVPVERLAKIVSPHDTEGRLRLWQQYGGRLDGYILRDESGMSYRGLGVRYGPKPEHYLSPYASDREGLDKLFDEFAFMLHI